ncbi:MAG: DUF1345 domain-containing protein [Tessaracoccus sp.]|uniref:DUF1345 domain-containing protein n=1 Tax=Tessaracoccus sp. TaxID=1971211 RepID=UPI001ED79BD7|nr:DUF1345 domain-containing protein [Tessaracoccus sp.]MBK7822370.1 DUF1345 domain-containing protein [Tessaracoccus sp.]
MGRTAHRYVRLAVSLILGIVAGLLGGPLGPGAGALLGWSVGALVYGLWTWGRVWGLDVDQTRAHAQEEDPGRGLMDALLVVAAIGSVGGVALVLVAAKGSGIAAATLGVAGVVASWVLIHTVYGVRYADLYFSAPAPPIDFGDEQPTYTDFAYLSFCLGMTYQISDTNLKTRQLRKVVLWHTLLSYFLGAVVLACTINLVSGLAA